jgi:hypothetical protein
MVLRTVATIAGEGGNIHLIPLRMNDHHHHQEQEQEQDPVSLLW